MRSLLIGWRLSANTIDQWSRLLPVHLSPSDDHLLWLGSILFSTTCKIMTMVSNRMTHSCMKSVAMVLLVDKPWGREIIFAVIFSRIIGNDQWLRLTSLMWINALWLCILMSSAAWFYWMMSSVMWIYWMMSSVMLFHAAMSSILWLQVVMSSLIHETEAIQEVIRAWLVHAIQCDDINRILEPFLILLLESDTSRTSVQSRCEWYHNDKMLRPTCRSKFIVLCPSESTTTNPYV